MDLLREAKECSEQMGYVGEELQRFARDEVAQAREQAALEREERAKAREYELELQDRVREQDLQL